MSKGNENKANFLKFHRFYIGGPFERLYLENAHYPIASMVLNALLYIFEAKKIR